MIDFIGWTGSLLLAICGLPQAYHAIKYKHANGITWGFISMWLSGEILTLIYISPSLNLPLLVNYSANILFLLIIIFYKVR
jgi:uncharacterized protein with PQ loop repeat